MSSERNFSPNLKANLNKVCSDDPLIYAVEISSTFLSEPLRIVCLDEDYTANIAPSALPEQYQTFIGLAFTMTLPSDQDKQESLTTIEIDNVNGILGKWIDQTNGAPGIDLTLYFYLKSQPEQYEQKCKFIVKQISIDPLKVSFDLGQNRSLNKAGVGVNYSKIYFPGLY